MRRAAIWLAALAFVLSATACSSSGDGEQASDEATTTTAATSSTASTDTSVVEMSIPEAATATSNDAGGGATGASGKVIMLKLHVDDVDDGEQFYETVFGATLAYDLGEGIRVLTMPHGPGFILIQDDPAEQDEWNASFLIQVPDLQAAKALAEENGATAQQSFQGDAGGQDARSVDMLDPWGNQIEILQLH